MIHSLAAGLRAGAGPEDANSSRAIFDACLESHGALLSGVEASCSGPLERLAALSAEALQRGGKLLFFGNGGSAADAQHMAAELTVRFVERRRALAGIALAVDVSTLTACANDFGFETVFARQIEALGRPGDIAIGFSTSGNSPNIIRAIEQASAMGLTAAAFTGHQGGRLNGIADPLLIVPSAETARIQEMHILLGHILCSQIEALMGLV